MLANPRARKKVETPFLSCTRFFSFYLSKRGMLHLRAVHAGRYVEVYMATHIATGAYFAAKIVPLQSKSGADDATAMKEAMLQMRLRHKHIVRIVDVFHESGVQGCFIEELMRGGTVHEWRATEGALKESDACAIFSRLMHALQYLHKHDVVHCDIKLENLLLAGGGFYTFPMKLER